MAAISTQVVEVNTRTRFMNYSTTIDLTNKSNVFAVLNSSNGTRVAANIEYSVDGVTWALFGDYFDVILIPHMNKVIEVSNEHILKMPFIRIAFNVKDPTVENSTVNISVYDVSEPSTSVYLAGDSFSHITTNTTTVVKSGSGIFHSLLVNISGLVTARAAIYDNTSASGTVIAVVDTTRTSALLLYNVSFTTGLTIVTTGGTAADLTVTYR